MAPVYRWDDFTLDLDRYRLEHAGRPVPLEPKAFDLLALMVRRPDRLISKQEIFETIWRDTAVTDHALTRVVAQLRRALGDEARESRYIETVPTRGYRWIRPVDVVDASSPLPAPAAADRPAGHAVAGSAPRPARASAIAAGLLVLVTLAALAWMSRSMPTTASTAEADATGAADDGRDPRGIAWPVQLTTHGGLDMHPALSPQGDALAYSSDRSGAFEIYVRALGGGSADVALTRDLKHNVQPAWSPDGRWIAYHSAHDGGIWVVSSRGGTPRQIVASGSRPAWSPDGRQIAFQSDEHVDVTPSGFGAQSGSTIGIVEADGANAGQLTSPGRPMGGHAGPTWSPDGRHVAFTVFDSRDDHGVWLATPATGEVRPLQRGAGLFEIVFAPDQSALYAAGGGALVVRLPLDAPTLTPRGPPGLIPVPGVPRVRGLSIAADGRRLAFAGLALSSHIWAQPVSSDGAPTGAARALTTDTSQRNSLPAVSPDGSRIAYMSTRSGQPANVWVMGIDGGEPAQVTADETSEFKPHWMPDGRRVAYLSNRGASPGLWAVDLVTRREERLFDMASARAAGQSPLPPGQFSELDLAPSMTRAAFTLLTPPAGRRVTYVTGLERFAPRALTDPSEWVGYPAWSPDERRLAVEIKDGSSTQAAVIDVATAAMRRLTNERGQTWVRSWSPDGRRLAVAVLRAGVWSLQWIDADSGAHGVLTPPVPPRQYVRYPDWSPRGDVVVFERGEMRGNIWTLTLPTPAR